MVSFQARFLQVQREESLPRPDTSSGYTCFWYYGPGYYLGLCSYLLWTRIPLLYEYKDL